MHKYGGRTRRPGNKYRARKTVVDGITFDSVAEGRRYGELKMMQAAGLIKDLQLQPRFLLQEGFRSRWWPEKVRPIHVTWDFLYQEGERQVVEDVKSPPTRQETAYSIRRRLFLRRYPEIAFRET
jgi:hypothetical protein